MTSVLAIDVENTDIALGIFQKNTLAHHWRISTLPHRTADEMGILLMGLFHHRKVALEEIRGVVVSSVVPPVSSVVDEMCKAYFGLKPLFVGPGMKTGIVVKYENPRDAGADRIANAVAAVHRYGSPIIVVDLRTATTFTVVNQQGHYVGGVIAPGVKTSAEALFTNSARLPHVDLAAPKAVLGSNPLTSMQSGIVYGHAGSIDYIIERIAEEIGSPAQVIATGSLASLVVPHCKARCEMVPHLTLDGLRLLWNLNMPGHSA